jgi:3-deoxy-manno-octulosonate cytidylyltransferase (CMP-KDO synthetase)
VKAVGYIPARMGSSRYPGKPLAEIAGEPMLMHCWRGSNASELLDEVLIATCDEEIRDWAEGAGIGCVMTSPDHERATDRVAEAAERSDADAIVLIQGDEPLVEPSMIDGALRPVLEQGVGCTNLVKRIGREEAESPNTVKVVFDRDWDAMYFARSVIPTPIHGGWEGVAHYKQVAVFGFTRARLLEFAALEPTPLEIAESVDMLRYVEHGRSIRFVETDVDLHAVDVPEDIAVVERMLRNRSGA